MRPLVLGTAVALTAAAPALAAVDFGPPEPVESTHGIAEFRYYGDQVGVDAAGNGYIGMKRSVVSGSGVDEQAMVLRRCAGSGWTPSVTAGSSRLLTHAHDLAVSAGGAAILVWTDENGGKSDLYSSYRPAGGEWGAPQPIASDGLSEVDVEIDDAGNAAVAWVTGSIYRTVYASYRPTTGTWEQATELPGLHIGQLAMSGAGEVAVVGQVGLSGSGALRAFIRPPGQPWPAGGEPVPTPPGGPGANDGPDAVEYDGAGRLIVLDREFSDVEATVRSGGGWGSTEILYDGLSAGAAVLDLARHPQGAVAVWRVGDDLHVARFAGGGWETPRVYASGGEQYTTASAAADATGAIVVAATRITARGHEVWGATADGIGAPWSGGTSRLSPAAVNGGRYYRDPAAGGGKHLVVAWTAQDASSIGSQAIATGAAPSCDGTPPPPPADGGGPPPPAPQPATPTPTPAPKPAARPKIGSFVKLPACARGRTLKVKVRVPRGQNVTRVELRVNGKRKALRRAPRIAGTVTLRKLPRRFRFEAIVTLKSGSPVKGSRRLKACR